MPANLVLLSQSRGTLSRNQPDSRSSCPWKIIGIPGDVNSTEAAAGRSCAVAQAGTFGAARSGILPP